MNFELTQEQQLLADTARAFVDRHADGDDPWPTMSSAGWAGLLVPEEHGGTGVGVVELALVCEALGRGPVASPLVASAVSTVLPVRWLGTNEQRERWLATLATGASVGTMALLEPGMRDEWDAVQMPGDVPLSGTKLLVPWASRADVIVVATVEGFRLVDPGHGVQIEQHHSLDAEPTAAVTLQGAAAELLGGSDDGAQALAHVLDHLAVVRLAYAVGAAEGALELSVEHVTSRHQFGRPIGSFQAVAHRCAEMRAEIDACRYLAYRAAWALDQEHDATLAVATAKSYANDAIRRVFLHAHQVHGAMGFTTEYPLHRFTQCAKAFELSYGGTARHRDRLATAIGLGARS